VFNENEIKRQYATQHGGAQTGYATPVDERSSVQRALDGLSSALASLQGNIEMLNGEISPVSRPESPTPLSGSNEAGQRLPTCEIENQIVAITALVHLNAARLASIRERLCV
jgi:hypothetical protein